MRTVEEIKADLKDCYACEQKECLFPIPTICGKPQDASVIAYEAEMGKAIINLFGIGRLEEICNAEREGRCVVLPCKVGDIIYRIANGEIQPCIVQYFNIITGDDDYEIETIYIFGNGLKAGATRHLWGKTVLLTREATEAALREREQDDD